MARKKQASGFLKTWIDSAPRVPEEPISPDAAKAIDVQLSIARAALDDLTKHIKRRLRTGDKVRAPFEKSNADRSADSEARAEKLQRDAAAKWAEPQHAHKSATAIAKLIDPQHWNTTRRKIKRR